MTKFNGDDLLTAFNNNVNVDLRNLNPNVIRGWFDTDCEKTKMLLNWLCVSLMSENYLSPLEKTEFDNIREPLNSQQCSEQLTDLDPNYWAMLDNKENLEGLLLIRDERDLLEDENKYLDKLIKLYHNIDNNISLDLSNKTENKIDSIVECKKLQEMCEHLSRNLDESNRKLQKMLVKYVPDSHLVNFIDVNNCHESFEKINSFCEVIMDIDQTFLESSDKQFSSELDICSKNILHSHQIYLVNEVETEKLKKILDFLCTTKMNEIEILLRCDCLPAKELYKKRMCDLLDNIAFRFADHSLKQARIHYVEQEYKELQHRHENVSKALENVNKHLAYYTVINCLQLEEKKEVNCINDFYQKVIAYINEELYKCRARTRQMKEIIEDYNAYKRKPMFETSKLFSSIAKILVNDKYTLNSTAEAVCKFKMELKQLQVQTFCTNYEDEKKSLEEMNASIKNLQNFLMSGPTNRIVLIPLNLQKVWSEIEEHLRSEDASILQAVQVPHTRRKLITKAQNYTKQLWMHFLTDPSKLDFVLEQAQEDFKKKTQQYF